MHDTRHAAQRARALEPVSSGPRAHVSIAPLSANARFSLRLYADAAATIGAVAGFRIDIPINTCRVERKLTSARLGPDEWLLLGPEAESERLKYELEGLLAGRFFSLVDIGQRNAALSVSGPRARDVINGGCPINLADEAFPAGSATRTLLGKAEIVLIRASTEQIYHVECWRSFAPYVHSFLNDVAREFENA